MLYLKSSRPKAPAVDPSTRAGNHLDLALPRPMAAQSGSIRPHRQQWCQTVGILVMMLFVGYDLYLNATADFDATSTPYVTLVSQILSIMLVLVLFLMLAIETHPCKVGLVKVRHRVRTLRSCAPLSLSPSSSPATPPLLP